MRRIGAFICLCVFRCPIAQCFSSITNTHNNDSLCLWHFKWQRKVFHITSQIISCTTYVLLIIWLPNLIFTTFGVLPTSYIWKFFVCYMFSSNSLNSYCSHFVSLSHLWITKILNDTSSIEHLTGNCLVINIVVFSFLQFPSWHIHKSCFRCVKSCGIILFFLQNFLRNGVVSMIPWCLYGWLITFWIH